MAVRIFTSVGMNSVIGSSYFRYFMACFFAGLFRRGFFPVTG